MFFFRIASPLIFGVPRQSSQAFIAFRVGLVYLPQPSPSGVPSTARKQHFGIRDINTVEVSRRLRHEQWWCHSEWRTVTISITVWGLKWRTKQLAPDSELGCLCCLSILKSLTAKWCSVTNAQLKCHRVETRHTRIGFLFLFQNCLETEKQLQPKNALEGARLLCEEFFVLQSTAPLHQPGNLWIQGSAWVRRHDYTCMRNLTVTDFRG